MPNFCVALARQILIYESKLRFGSLARLELEHF